MILTGITKAMLEKAVREEPLLKGATVPTGAVETVAMALHEHSCAEWDHAMDEQKAWGDLPIGSKQVELRNATWLIGRLFLKHYRIVRA